MSSFQSINLIFLNAGMRCICILLMLLPAIASAQETVKGRLKGQVVDELTGVPVPFASVVVDGGRIKGALSDTTGAFSFEGLLPGNHTLKVSHVGHVTYVNRRVVIVSGQTTEMVINLVTDRRTLQEITVRPEPFKNQEGMPVLVHSLGNEEISRNPGSDNDVSKVIRALPGVASVSSFRNDLIIRGGAPNENRFFIDDIEVPVLNHLTTQGASGGAYSIINSNHLREVDYMSSFFKVNHGNALSSVFDFKLRETGADTSNYTVWMGGTETGVAVEKSLGKGSGMLLSARRSYRQYILQMLNFAFLPVYNDVTAKFRIRTGKNSSLTLLGIGALDDFTLNEDVGDNEIQRYLLDNLPVSDQSNYTAGAVYRVFKGNAGYKFIVSRSELKNRARKYYQNDDSNSDNLLLDYDSREQSNRGRFEYTYKSNGFSTLVGFGMDDITATFDVFNRSFNANGPQDVAYGSKLRILQYGIFAQTSKSFFNDVLTINLGVRTDAADFNTSMNRPLDHVSTRLGMAIQPFEGFSINASWANYHQLPPLNTLGYAESAGTLANQTQAQYLKSTHYTAGVSWENRHSGRLSLEGYYKYYPNQMTSLRDSISIAHIPVDFGVFGNYPVNFNSKGRAYGFELFYQQRLYKGYYGMLSYTLGWSEYTDVQGSYVPSAWDARHIVSTTLGRKLGDKWEIGFTWRMQSPLPFTPFDAELSSLRPVWDVNNQGVRDYSRLHASRGKYTNMINARVDRVFKFRNFTMNVYMDLENILSDADSQQALIQEREKFPDGGLGAPVVLNPGDPVEQQRYSLKYIQNAQGAFIPTFGFIVSF